MTEPAADQLFTGLRKDEIGVILAAATKRKVKAFDIVMSSDQVAKYLFLVRAGCMNFYFTTIDGREVLLRRLVPGNIFGLASFLSEPTADIGSVQAIQDSEFLAWEHRIVRQLARAYPQLAENALGMNLRHLARCVRRHIGLLSQTAQDRLANVLINLASSVGRTVPAGIVIDVRNEDLSSLADISLFTTSRLLRQWERKGAVQKSRGKVLLCHPDKMVAA